MINPYEIIKQILSKDGLNHEFFCIKFQNYIDMKISQEDDKFVISFKDSKPTISLKKHIRLNLKVSGLVLGETGGIIRIDLFPDIPFKYDWLSDKT